MIRFTIDGKLPDLNSYIDTERSHRLKAAKMKKKVGADIALQIKAQVGNRQAESPVSIRIVWHSSTKRRDPDNIAWVKKFILDALVRCGTLKSDGYNHITKFVDEFHHTGRDCAEVLIYEAYEPLEPRCKECGR